MDVRRGAEVPDEGRPFQAPDVLFPVVTQVVGLVERHMQPVKSAGIQNAKRLLHMALMIRGQQGLDHLPDQSFLVIRKFAGGDAGKVPKDPGG